MRVLLIFGTNASTFCNGRGVFRGLVSIINRSSIMIDRGILKEGKIKAAVVDRRIK